MIHNAMGMGEAGIVSIASMLVVFAVLLLLYVLLIVSGPRRFFHRSCRRPCGCTQAG